MLNERYLLAAKNLAESNMIRLETNRDPRQKEIDSLFEWVISALDSNRQAYWPAKTSYQVTVKEVSEKNSTYVVLEYGKVISQYISLNVTKNEFYGVMQDVAGIFNEIGIQKQDGYAYYATCHIESEKSELTVNLTTNI